METTITERAPLWARASAMRIATKMTGRHRSSLIGNRLLLCAIRERLLTGTGRLRRRHRDWFRLMLRETHPSLLAHLLPGRGRMTSRFGAVAFICACALSSGDVATQSPRPDPSALTEAVDSLVRRAVAAGIAPGVGVALAMDGRVIYAKSHGAADASAGKAADDQTLWYVASTSKSFTGFAVALLAHQGALRFEDPIGTFLPRAQWHPNARPQELTVARFLSHTHNLNDNAVVSSAAFTGAIPEGQWPSLLHLAVPRPVPGLVYSNFGYNVAAMVIDALKPEGWRKYLEQNVYQPAGMRQTFARISGLDARRIAKPHRLRSDGRFETQTFFKTDATMNSAGGHLATLNDLARWTIVQMDGGKIDGRQVFPAAAVALSHRLIEKHTNDNARRFAYFDREGWGAGWDVGSYSGEPMVSRFGGYHSFRSHLSFLPRRRIGVVAVTNGGLGSSLADAIAAFAYDLEAGRPEARDRAEQRLTELQTRRTASLQQAAKSEEERAARQGLAMGRPLTDFTGQYSEPSYGEVVISERNGRLEYRWGAVYGPAEPQDPAKGQLRIEIAGGAQTVTFELPQTGAATSLSLQGVTFSRRR
jgi:CubicO group peptidase (beta-lactamase class C family)